MITGHLSVGSLAVLLVVAGAATAGAVEADPSLAFDALAGASDAADAADADRDGIPDDLEDEVCSAEDGSPGNEDGSCSASRADYHAPVPLRADVDGDGLDDRAEATACTAGTTRLASCAGGDLSGSDDPLATLGTNVDGPLAATCAGQPFPAGAFVVFACADGDLDGAYASGEQAALAVVPCTGDAVTRHPGTGDVTYCFGADVYVGDLTTPVLTKRTGTVAGGFPHTLPADTPKTSDPGFLSYTPPDTATGTPASVTVQMERRSVNADGTTSAAGAPPFTRTAPAIKVVPCAGPATRDPLTGDVTYCVGADVFVDDMATPLATRQTGVVPGGFPHTLPADTPKATDSQFVTYTLPDTDTGTPASVTVKMERVTVTGDGTTSSAPAAPVTHTGPAIKIVPCPGPATMRDPTTGDVTYCTGADVFVNDLTTPVVARQTGTIPGGFPKTLPADTPALDDADFLAYTLPNTETGAPASVTIKMERVTVKGDGSITAAEAAPIVVTAPAGARCPSPSSCGADHPYASHEAGAEAGPGPAGDEVSVRHDESTEHTPAAGHEAAGNHTATLCVGDALATKGCVEDADRDGRLLLAEGFACSDPTSADDPEAAAPGCTEGGFVGARATRASGFGGAVAADASAGLLP